MKKEITIAASSAVALIIFFGSVSYLLFPQGQVSPKPPQEYKAFIDGFTQHDGKGAATTGGNFSISQNDAVHLYAEVRNASNIPQGSRLVAFEIHWPALRPHNGSIYDLGAKQTNASGIAEITSIPISFLQNPEGTWLVYVTASIDEQHLADTLTFIVKQ